MTERVVWNRNLQTAIGCAVVIAVVGWDAAQADTPVSTSVFCVSNFSNCVSGSATFGGFQRVDTSIHRCCRYFFGHDCMRSESECFAANGTPERRVLCRACGLTPV
jgi:hypothetical protein